MLTPSGPMGQTHWGDAASNTANPSVHSTDAQLKVTPLVSFVTSCLWVNYIQLGTVI
jgi:hypothetical protein